MKWAGVSRLERELFLLERKVLPLNDTPNTRSDLVLFLAFLVFSMRAAPLTEFLKRNRALHLLFIFGGEIIEPLALTALQFD